MGSLDWIRAAAVAFVAFASGLTEGARAHEGLRDRIEQANQLANANTELELVRGRPMHDMH